ncbi:MAG: glycoside hydrolase family 65 protein [Nitrospira sp.]|nr:glycoside hydrolase family 65 protein [Nitrospira sp.]MCW5786759.1 glycoside hydrolase family 65 protein [Nitrospira sp.]
MWKPHDKAILSVPDQGEEGVSAATPLLSARLPFAVDPRWALVEAGFDQNCEPGIESIFTVANGYVGTRGSLDERAGPSSPVTYLAGVFTGTGGAEGVLKLAELPDWTHLRVLLDGVPLSLETGTTLDHRRILDLQHGVLFRQWRHQDDRGRVTMLTYARAVCLHDRHLLLQSLTITPDNYEGDITIHSATNNPRSEILWSFDLKGDTALLLGETNRGTTIAMASHSRLRQEKGLENVGNGSGEACAEQWVWRAQRGAVARFDRSAVVYSSREVRDPAEAAIGHVRRAAETGLDAHLLRHTQAWEERWCASDVEVVGDETAQRALRFAAYHLNSAVNPQDERVSIGARALTGPTYKGHVFWDTEIYVLPFYTFTDPAAARSLLQYRFHTLPAARDRARRLGYQGALYAWESADTGADVTPETVRAPDGRVVQVLTGIQEHHISADIAYAVWQYWQATADEEFVLTAGAEILIETARFWASRGRVEPDGRYHIRTVIGPDEYHESVDDNAYTNVMAQWNLERAAETVDWLRSRRADVWPVISERVRVTPDEPDSWRRTAALMVTGFDRTTNLFEQFAGFFDLEELDLQPYRPMSVPIDVTIGRERTQRAQVVKQADVIALSALLWERFPVAVHEANVRYYEPRTAHGSSLSPALHALVSARLGDADLAAQYFHDAAAIDLAHHGGKSAGGVHIATLGGLWQAAVLGMGGIRLREDGLVVDPHLPSNWDRLSFPLQWRGRRISVTIDREPGQVTVEVQSGEPMTIELSRGSMQTIMPHHRYVAHRVGPGWSAWQESKR